MTCPVTRYVSFETFIIFTFEMFIIEKTTPYYI